MTSSIVVVCFEEGSPRSSARPALKKLGFADGLDDRCRWHDPGLLCAQTEKGIPPETLDSIKDLPMVRRVVAIPADRPLYSQACRPVILPNGARVGEGLTVIAGPCSVEGERQVCQIAASVKEAGAKALRGGVFKPRTSPYEFGGLGERGLEYLARAREETGLPVVTEAMNEAQLELVTRYGDVIQIGSRNMHNFPFLFKVGSHPSGKPVLLKRGFAATLDELLMAAEYLLLGRLCAGHEEPGVILCERGIRTFEQSTRFTLDVGAIPALRERTSLPVFADPSHAAGQRQYVPPLSRAAVAAGAAGLLVEVHTEPCGSWCDGAQALEIGTFRDLMGDLRRIASASNRV